jgi:two-component system sensor histidine kinase DesK
MNGLRSLTETRRRFPLVARLIVPLLGVFFLVYPIQILLRSDLAPARVLLALCGAALFAGVFLWLMWTQEPLQLASAEPSEVLKVRLAIAVLAVLAGLLGFGVGPEWRMLFFYHLNVAAGIMLPRREAYAVVAGIVLLTFVAGLYSGFAFLAAPAAAIGLWSIAFVGQVAAVAQLKAAREDLLGHSLSTITLKSELAGRLLADGREGPRAAKEVRDIQAIARGALREVREAVSGYRQPTLAEELAGAEEMLEAAGIECRIEDGVGSLPKTAEAVLAWTVREGVTNVIRHSRARRCEIRLIRNGGNIRAEVKDDGHGSVHAGKGAGGNGLSGLAERVEKGGGDFEAGPLAGRRGFRLRVDLPLEDDAATRGGEREQSDRSTRSGKDGP